MGEDLKIVLGELRELRKEGCNVGAANSTKIGVIEKQQIQHDKRLSSAEKDISSIHTKFEHLPEQVSTQVIEKMNGSLKGDRTMIPIKLTVLGNKIDTTIPASWLGWAAVIIIMLGLVGTHKLDSSEVKETLTQLQRMTGTNIVSRIHE